MPSQPRSSEPTTLLKAEDLAAAPRGRLGPAFEHLFVAAALLAGHGPGRHLPPWREAQTP